MIFGLMPWPLSATVIRILEAPVLQFVAGRTRIFKVPLASIRAKLDRLISRDHFEHIIVFIDQQAKRQICRCPLARKASPSSSVR